MSVIEIRPLDLIAGMNVTMKSIPLLDANGKMHMSDESPPAWAEKFKTSGYRITINEPVAWKIYNNSWIQGKVTWEEIKCGFLLHEVAHIKYDSWQGDSQRIQQDGVYDYCDHVIEDARIEYQLSLEHPQYAKFFHWLLSAVKQKMDAKELARVPREVVEKYTRDLYYLTRFGTIRDDADPEFVDFVLPILVSSPRSHRMNAIAATRAIYYWITDKVEEAVEEATQKIILIAQGPSKPGKGQSAQGEKGTESDDDEGGDKDKGKGAGKEKDDDDKADAGSAPAPVDIDAAEVAPPDYEKIKTGEEALTQDELDENLDGGDQIAASNSATIVDMDKTAREQSGDDQVVLVGSGTGVGAGDGTTMKLEQDGNAFYKATLQSHGPQIDDLRNMFKRFKNAPKPVGAYDGDLNMMMQQGAYMNSITGDDGEDFLVVRSEEIELDMAILRDVSGSTDAFKKEYAEALVASLAAVEMMPGVRTGAVDFSTGKFVHKTFDDDLKASSIYPRANGGTSIQYAMEEIAGWYWKSPNKLVVIITDGGIWDMDHETTVTAMTKLRGMGVEFVNIDVRRDGPKIPNLSANPIVADISAIAQVVSATALAQLQRNRR